MWRPSNTCYRCTTCNRYVHVANGGWHHLYTPGDVPCTALVIELVLLPNPRPRDGVTA